MYIYIDSEKNGSFTLRTVGFYNPDGKFIPESDHDTQESAAARVAYLNGQASEDEDFRENVEIILRQYGLIL